MFEAAEIGRSIGKAEFEAALEGLRPRLLEAQRQLRETTHSVLVVVSGVEGSGKSQVINRLHEWLDARGMNTTSFWRESDEERERPGFWRYWRSLPRRGTIGIFYGSWYTQPIVDRVFRKTSRTDLDAHLQKIVRFEQMLAADGALIVKLWLHLPEDVELKRFEEKAERKEKNWSYGRDASKYAKHYGRFAKVSERVIRFTDTAEAPWHVIEATDRRYRDLTVARLLVEALEDLNASRANAVKESPVVLAQADEEALVAGSGATVLDQVDLKKTIDPAKYEKTLEKLQEDVGALVWKAWDQRRSIVAVFEGWDAAGKGGAIRRLIAPIDARLYRVISVAAPTEEERAQHYLWRFWRQVPRAGAMTIYDRSWYGRVLVERVEKFARVDEWARAYREINDFEEELVESGIILMKFWLHIDKAEQHKRFKERQKTPWKQHKITDEDWRNRNKWDAYRTAVHDMVSRTSSAAAPWSLIAANDKHAARVEVLSTVVKRLKKELKQEG